MTAPRSRLSGKGVLGDLTASPRMILIASLAGLIGLLGAVLAVVLLRLIAFFTNLFFYHASRSGTRALPTSISDRWLFSFPSSAP